MTSTAMSHAAVVAAEPPFRIILRQQLSLLWASRRPALLAVLMVGSLAMMRLILLRIDQAPALLFAQVSQLIVLVSGGWALIVWRDDPPKSRRYHWSLPVDMAYHDLARVLAGAVWLVAAIVIFYLAGSLLALAEGQGAELVRAGPVLALHCLLTPLLAYLLLSSIGVASNRPFEWVLGLFIGVQGFIAVSMLLDSSGVMERVVEALIGRNYGLGWALVAGGMAADARMHDAAGVRTTADLLASWLPAAFIWFVIAGGLVTLLAFRRRGRA